MTLDIIASLPQGYTWVFFVIALIAGSGYAIQQALVARYGRVFDPFLVTSCRNLSFLVTLSPLLLLAPKGSLDAVLQMLPYLVFAALFGALAVVIIYFTQRSFPVGVVSGFQQMSQVWLLVLSFVFLQERIGILTALSVLVLLCGVMLLAFLRSSFPHLNQVRLRDFGLIVLFPLLMGSAYFLVAFVGQQTNMLVAGYVWEVLIGVSAFAIFLVRRLLLKVPPSKNQRTFQIKDIFWIAVFSSGTLLGTGGAMILYGIASPGVAQTAVSSVQMIGVSLLGMWLYREHLKIGQWLAIIVIIIGLALLKIVA